ncbi:uncharacterized protein LOC119604985 [Lucilia sericata]|uniref:uncharacterized protein LOC119604985 n=1 Tax=Lucilia sericata TaxID=13632 RepID=UPI0018A80EDB|nr:uncharacterized protein LOC119604985 [Lucilia sericata]
MKMFHKFINPGEMKRSLWNGKKVCRRGEGFWNVKGKYLLTILLLMTVVLQCLVNNVEAKLLVQRSKKTLKLLQSSSSLIQLRHKRDTFANEHHEQRQQQPGEDFVSPHKNYYENIAAEDEANDDYYYDDDNYDVLPIGNGNSQSPSLGDQISETAKQIAESFKNMWQSLTDSIRHCMEKLRASFTETIVDDLTPEELQQLHVAMSEQYHAKHIDDNEVYENKL